MKKRYLLLALAVLIQSCGRQQQQAPDASAPAASKQPAEVHEIMLDTAMQEQIRLKAVEATVRSLPHVISANGRIAVNEVTTWRVGAITDGRIIRVMANVGSEVRQEEVLARMHSHDIHESRALYRKSIADLAQARAQETYARRVRDRARRLYELKATSLEQVEQSEAEFHSAETALSNAQLEVERTKTHLEQFLGIPPESKEDHGAPETHGDDDLVPIKAPATGTVLSRSITPGSVVAPASELFVVSDLSTLWMIASVAEEHLPHLRPGLSVRLSVQAYPNRSFPGRIIHLGEELDPTTRTIRARVLVPNSAGLLKPEMYATAEIEIGASQPALFVPQTAIQEIKGEAVVFVQTGPDRFEMRRISTGRSLDGFVEAASGVRSGERVVAEGSFLLKSQLLRAEVE